MSFFFSGKKRSVTPTFDFSNKKSIFLHSCCEKIKSVGSCRFNAKYDTFVTFPIDSCVNFPHKCDFGSDSQAETCAVTGDPQFLAAVSSSRSEHVWCV